MNFGNALKELRKLKKMSQQELADAVGYSATYINYLEKGKRKPSVEFLDKLGYATKIPIPIIMWYALDESSIDFKKKETFRLLKPSVDKLIEQFI